MTTVNLHKFRVKYRLTRAAAGERRRLDQILGGVVGGALEDALARAGVPADAEVCVRRVFVPVHLRLSRADSALSALWGEALAQSIRRALDGGQDSLVAVFESRAHALLDMAAGVARGDLGRAWAWKQLGLWRADERAGESEALAELVRALAEQHERVVPLLVELAARGTLSVLARGISDEQWTTLARAAVSTYGGRPLVEVSGDPGHARAVRLLNEDARRIYAASRIARASGSRLFKRGSGSSSADAARALATLAVLEVEPALFAAGAAGPFVDAVAALARREAAAPASVEREDEMSAVEVELARDGVGGSDLPQSEVAAELRRESAEGADGQGNEDAEIVRDARQRGFTRSGGLLFLLGVLEDLGLPAEMLYHEALSRRSLRWTLQQLALALLPLEPCDAAALAFAGLRPFDPAPAEREDAATEEELAAVRAFAARVVAGLRERLARAARKAAQESSREPDTELLRLSDVELIGRVCRRRAEIVADPGWFEVVMSLEEVSTEVRRAGLDLDPGHVTWLGVVLRFIYE
jgi:hypothetical protein